MTSLFSVKGQPAHTGSASPGSLAQNPGQDSRAKCATPQLTKGVEGGHPLSLSCLQQRINGNRERAAMTCHE